MRTAVFTILFLGCLYAAVSGQDFTAPDTVRSAPGITIESEVDKSDIYIGDLINYRLSVIYDSGLVLTPPPIGANLGAFDVKDYQSDDATVLDDGRRRLESRFLLTTFTTGDYMIPPIPIEYMTADSIKKIIISEPIAIRVNSLLAEDSDTLDIRDIKAPFEFKTGRTWIYYLAGAVVLIGLLVTYIIWRRRRKGLIKIEPVDLRKPWEIAFEELAILNEKNLPGQNEFKLYYIELSEILRAFLGRVYEIPVLDMTTEEFCGAFIEQDISEELYDRVKKVLMHADLVKFAKHIPESERMRSDFDEVHGIIENIMGLEQSREAAVTVTANGPTTGGTDV